MAVQTGTDTTEQGTTLETTSDQTVGTPPKSAHDHESAAPLPVGAAAPSHVVTTTTTTTSSSSTTTTTITTALGRLGRRLQKRLPAWGFEARGIARVPPSERAPASAARDLRIALLWFSANLSANNLVVGLYGPTLFRLGFLDSAMCAVFGALLGSLSTGYMAIWGPRTGNRTMVVLRFFFGWWPAKLPTLLNIILMVGYCTIDGILGGQLLAAAGGGRLSVAVGVVVVNLACAAVVLLGMRPFERYEHHAWLPQLLLLAVLVGCAGPGFDPSAASAGPPAAVAANRLSFLSMCLYVPNSWSAAASDFYVYYPEATSSLKVAALTVGGLWVSFSLVFMIGIGLASGLPTEPTWAAAWGSGAPGALLAAGFAPLGGFGRACAVGLALGLVSNSIPGTYAATMCAQVLGRRLFLRAVPRWAWACVFVVLELALGLGGRNDLYVILSNFLALMGYWIEFMTLIVVMETCFFRRHFPYDWARWDDSTHMPIGLAAGTSFLLGWAGAILGMNQTWYVGPLARLAGTSDVGVWVGMAFTLVSFPPLRWWELARFGR